MTGSPGGDPKDRRRDKKNVAHCTRSEASEKGPMVHALISYQLPVTA